ncbi:unnamed protein product [Cylindrotheca closterium]|uniref:Uncharacterized protein n=1 Tax=Cylindrotheca closterium TaxID=2856 RepID=A0AAD2G6I9_9STRA|nr:unnamed protein product [Cylindrotheca closterium]
MMIKSFLTILVLSVCQFYGNAFVTPSNTKVPVSIVSRPQQQQHSPLFLSDDNNSNNNNSSSDEDRLRALGYSEDEIRRSKEKDAGPPREVRVDLVNDIDATTLTFVGFGLIAFNFFVLANAGDGGIAGVVASIINTMNN